MAEAASEVEEPFYVWFSENGRAWCKMQLHTTGALVGDVLDAVGAGPKARYLYTYSVLAPARPTHTTPMRPFTGSVSFEDIFGPAYSAITPKYATAYLSVKPVPPREYTLRGLAEATL